MGKEYVYRKHLREPIKYFMGVYLVAAAIILVNLNGFGIIDGDSDLGALFLISLGIILGFALIFIIEVTILHFVMLRRFKRIKVSLHENGILYENIKGKTFLAYENIESIETPQIKYTGGWVKINYRGGNIRLTVVLEGIGEFIKELKEELDKRELSSVYNEKKLFSFYKTAVFSDYSWERIYEYAFKLTAYLLLNSALVIFLGTILDGNSGLLLLSVMLSTLGYIVGEIILGKSMAKLTREEEFYAPSRDRELEKNIYIKVLAISSAIIVLITVILSM